MSLQQIESQFDGCVLYQCEADSLLLALQTAVKNGANLYGANLYGANLDGANLTRANLDGANLDGANLYKANLDGQPILNIVQVSGIGSCRRLTAAIILKNQIYIQCGCFNGNLADFSARIEAVHAQNPQFLAEYHATINWIQSCADAVRESKREVAV